MDRASTRKVGPVRNRLPSNNSTPSSSTSRGTSTPTGSTSKNRSCNFSPITNPDVMKQTSASDKGQPKMLKPLGPSFPHNTAEKRAATFKTRTAEEQAALLYMAYQQQHFLNNALEEAKEKVQAGCKKQLEDLWGLVKDREHEVTEMEDRTRLVQNHSKLTHLVDQFETTVKEATETIQGITEIAKDLGLGLDVNRHQIRLDDINHFGKEEMNEVVNVLKEKGNGSKQIQVEKLKSAVKAVTAISQLDDITSKQIKIMEECQRMSSLTITRLGQEVALSEDTNDFRKLSELEI